MTLRSFSWGPYHNRVAESLGEAARRVNVDLPMAYHQLRIAKIVQETPDARSFVLEVPDDLADRFRYRAGQFLTFRVPHDAGRLQPLLFAVERARDRRPRLKVTVKRVTGGKGSNWFNDALKEGRPAARPAAGRPLRAQGRRRAPAAVRRRQRHHADDVADQVGAAHRHAPHPAVLCQPRQALDHLRQGAARPAGQPYRPARGHPSSRRRAGPDPAAGDPRRRSKASRTPRPICAGPARS